mmetsp:Transcript_34861/g.74168  ORF Transcript_34861/g.74168 Transcript_34861/m.74168 type:complete len:126 (-) Transcript_34861:310-687(-)
MLADARNLIMTTASLWELLQKFVLTAPPLIVIEFVTGAHFHRRSTSARNMYQMDGAVWVFLQSRCVNLAVAQRHQSSETGNGLKAKALTNKFCQQRPAPDQSLVVNREESPFQSSDIQVVSKAVE